MDSAAVLGWFAGVLTAVLGVVVAHLLADRRQKVQLDTGVSTALLLQDRAELRAAIVAVITSCGELSRAAALLRERYVSPDFHELGAHTRRQEALDAAMRLRHEMMSRVVAIEVFVGARHPLFVTAFAVVEQATCLVNDTGDGNDGMPAAEALVNALGALRVAAREHLRLAPPLHYLEVKQPVAPS